MLQRPIQDARSDARARLDPRAKGITPDVEVLQDVPDDPEARTDPEGEVFGDAGCPVPPNWVAEKIALSIVA